MYTSPRSRSEAGRIGVAWRALTAVLGLAGLLVTASVLTTAARAHAGLADQVGATFALMIDEFVEAFPAVDGMVVAVEGDRLYMDLSATDGVREGQEFTVFRRGEVFRHPISGKPLGRYEQHLGYAKVRRVFPHYSEAVHIPVDGSLRPRAEDGVRITRARITAAVTPLLDLTRSEQDHRRAPYLIAVALERTKRFQVVDPQRVADLLAEQGLSVEELLMAPAKAQSLKTDVDVAGWIVPVLLKRGGVTYLDVTWISGVTGTALFASRRELAPPGPAQEQRFPWEPRAHSRESSKWQAAVPLSPDPFRHSFPCELASDFTAVL